MAEYISHAVDLFLSEHSDEYGFAHVIGVEFNSDMSQAHIAIKCPSEKNEVKLDEKINRNKRAIAEKFEMYFNSKRTPKLNFKFFKIND